MQIVFDPAKPESKNKRCIICEGCRTCFIYDEKDVTFYADKQAFPTIECTECGHEHLLDDELHRLS